MLASASASTSRRRAHTGVWGSVCRRDSRAAKGGRAAWCRAVGEPRAMHLACRGPARQAPSEPAVSWPGWSWVRSLGWLQLSVVARRRGPGSRSWLTPTDPDDFRTFHHARANRRRGPGSRSSLLGVRVSLRQPPKHRASFEIKDGRRLDTPSFSPQSTERALGPVSAAASTQVQYMSSPSCLLVGDPAGLQSCEPARLSRAPAAAGPLSKPAPAWPLRALPPPVCLCGCAPPARVRAGSRRLWSSMERLTHSTPWALVKHEALPRRWTVLRWTVHGAPLDCV